MSSPRSAAARFRRPGWALLAAGNVDAWPAPAGVTDVLIAADRGQAGEAAAARLARQLRAIGITSEIALPPAPFGDWNEAAQEGWGRAEGARLMAGIVLAGRWRFCPMTSNSASAPTAMSRIQVRLGDLGLAKENLRFREPADDGVPQLAETIAAAGVVIPPIVRPGRKGELAFMALDGRRRRMGLLLLRDRGEVTDDYLVDCLLAETPAQQAAAILLPNTEHAPVHIADVILAIGRLRKAKMDTAAISAALGYAELEIRRLEALSAVHPDVLKALRQGRLNLRQVRLLARLPDMARQGEIAQRALDGYFQDYQLRQAVAQNRATVEDDRFVLVGMDRYIAAGGRVSSDLFGEYPDELLDPEILQAAWRDRVQPICEQLEARWSGRLHRNRRGVRGAGRLSSPALRLRTRPRRGPEGRAGGGP